MNFVKTVIELLNKAPLCYRSLSEDSCEELIDYLKENLSSDSYITETGLTKFVIIPKDKNEPYVIKIPFCQRFNEDAYDDACYEYGKWTEESGEEEPMDPERDDYFFPLEGAYRAKFNNAEWDYCGLEVALYKEAKIRGLDKYFAQEQIICTLEQHLYPVYIQQKVDSFYSYYDYLSREERESASARCSKEIKPYDMLFDATWVARFLDIYGCDEYKKLLIFLDEFDIMDFHRGNIGFYQGLPILFDYSGFDS